LHWLAILARASAVLGGVLLALITLLTCASVVGRNWLGASLIGDFELTGVLCAVAVAHFLPWCQLSRGNIIVDFFTARSPLRTNLALDRFGALLMALVMALLTWRTGVGGVEAWSNHSSSMLLGFPDWLVALGMVPALLLTSLVALGQAIGVKASNIQDAPHATAGEGYTP
jgi:TRAP-type C4-dicarboxylate transport system permease small subunit